jgi:hypothetical protein
MQQPLESFAKNICAASDEARAVRERLVGNRVHCHLLAEALGVQIRSIYAYMERGMPYSKIAGKRWVCLDEAKAWLEAQR